MEPDLIDCYLHELARSLPRARSLGDVLAEAEDHLREAAGRLVDQGLEPTVAQRITLERFGDLTVVARAYATSAGGLAMPTAFTRAAGKVACLTAALWLLTAVSAGVSSWTDPDDGSWIYPGVTVLAALAVIATTVVVAGMLVRSGGVRDAPAACSLALMSLAILLMAVAPWAWVFTTVPLTGAVVIAVRRTASIGLVMPWSDWSLMLAWPAGTAVALLGDARGAGARDSYGGYPWALLAGFTVAVVTFVVGLVGVGGRLTHEQARAVPDGGRGGGITVAGDRP